MQIDAKTIFFYSLIPAAVGVLGGFMPTLFRVREKALAALQHFVAGVVLAATATAVVPEVMKSTSSTPICVGFIVGVFALLLIHAIAHKIEDIRAKSFPLGGIFASMLDLFIDGILIGIAFSVGKGTGFLVTLSLSLCAFFLCLTIGGMVHGFLSRLISTLFIAAMLPLGAFVASLLVPMLYSSLYYEVISFGLAGLLFLACEELLKSAHQKKDTMLTTALFFAGFLLILAMKPLLST